MKKNNLLLLVPLLLSTLFSCNKDISNIDHNQNNLNTISLDDAVKQFQKVENRTISRSANNASFLTHPRAKLINFDFSKIHAINPVDACLFSKGSVLYDYGAELSGSHGNVKSGGGPAISLEVKRDVNGSYGSGIKIKYPFLRGNVYRISSRILPSKPNEPSQANFTIGYLHFGLSNTGYAQFECRSNVINRPIHLNDRVHSQNSVGTSTFSFSTSSTSNYLDINALAIGSVPINGGGNVNLSNLSLVEESAVELHSSTQNFDPINGTNFHFISRDNLVVGENFTWSVTGNLQIVGANVGSNVLIKSTSSTDFRGDIVAKLDGAHEFYRASISNCSLPHRKFINGQCETGVRTCTSSLPTGHSNQQGELYNSQYHAVFSDGTRALIESITSNRRCVTPD